MSGVTRYLQSWNLLLDMHPDLHQPPKDWKYRSFHDLVLQAGREYTYTPDLPDGVERGPVKECFTNATQAVLANPSLTYVEGFASGIIPCHHAWVTDDGHRAIEVTWDHEGEYHGIAFDKVWLLGRMVETNVYGVFQDMIETDWLQHGLPPEATA